MSDLDASTMLPFTEQELENFILEAVGLSSQNYKLLQWQTESIGIGYGLLSTILRANLEWNSPHKSLPKFVVVKIPNATAMAAHMKDLKASDTEVAGKFDELNFLRTLHTNECAFYGLFIGKNVPLRMPKPYRTKLISDDWQEPGFIVMEDMTRNSILVNMVDGLRLNQVFSIADELASLHAWSLKNPSSWKSHFPINKPFFAGVANMMTKSCEQLKQMKPGYFDDVLAKISPCFEPQYVINLVHSFETLRMPPVPCHGDLWMNNILFCSEETAENKGGDQMAAIVDWQVVHQGSVTEDLSRVTTTSMSPQLRRNHENEVLQHYYESLQKLMGGAVPFGFADVCNAYELSFIYGACVKVINIPMSAEGILTKGPDEQEKKNVLLERAKAVFDDLVQILENNPTIGV